MNRLLPLLAALYFGSLLPLAARYPPPPAPPDFAKQPYKAGEARTEYEKTRCELDLYLPAERKGFATLVWFHGGGLTSGHKDGEGAAGFARTFTEAGVAVAMANYRLAPQVTFPAYVEDAAAAFAWVRAHIAERGGEPTKVFIGGHSAGAYLTSMLGMDLRFLHKLGIDASAIAGLLPVSGQMMTHFSVRQERGLQRENITADEAAPIFFSRKETPPMLILMGDHDWPARLEENQYFAALQKSLGNKRVELQVIADRGHGSIVGQMSKPGDPGAQAMIGFIERISANRGGKP